jgi:7-carboxy-7-deazaguanine synthase
LVEVTGGEPLAQPSIGELLSCLCDEGYTVLLETSGALDISEVDERVIRVMDFKCPSSGEESRNRFANVGHLRAADEVKFVVGTEEDYAWMKEVVARHGLAERCTVLVSWAEPLQPSQRHPGLRRVPDGQRPMSLRRLAECVVADRLPVRFQVQMHKVIWPADQRGV